MKIRNSNLSLATWGAWGHPGLHETLYWEKSREKAASQKGLAKLKRSESQPPIRKAQRDAMVYVWVSVLYLFKTVVLANPGHLSVNYEDRTTN